jgi:hypothetical protein
VHLTLLAMALIAAATFAPPAVAQEELARRSLEEHRRVAEQVSRALRTQLIREMQVSGPLRSLVVCRYTCPEILFGPSRRTGWRIAAVSLKPRNSALGSPDEWEQKVLLAFERRAALGEPAEGLEATEVVRLPAGRYLRYARAMAVEPLCLTCHGTAEEIPEVVRSQLAIDYPQDKAVDFRVGQVYGILSIRRPM